MVPRPYIEDKTDLKPLGASASPVYARCTFAPSHTNAAKQFFYKHTHTHTDDSVAASRTVRAGPPVTGRTATNPDGMWVSAVMVASVATVAREWHGVLISDSTYSPGRPPTVRILQQHEAPNETVCARLVMYIHVAMCHVR